MSLNDLFNALDSPSECAPFRAQLEEYVDAQLNNLDYHIQFPALARHLDQCVTCAEEYGTHYERALVQRAPRADLGFLLSEPSLLQLLRQQIREGIEQLQVTLTPALVQQLAPLPTSAIHRSSPVARETLILDLDAAQVARVAPGLAASIRVYQDVEDDTLGSVHVTVEHPEKSWPELAGYRITLAGDAVRLEGTTDPHGESYFEGVPLDRIATLSITIAAPTA